MINFRGSVLRGHFALNEAGAPQPAAGGAMRHKIDFCLILDSFNI